MAFPLAARPSRGQPAAASRVVVVGGGFAGATAARVLAKAGHRVTMIEAEQRYVSGLRSNEVLAGLLPYADLQFGWDKLAAAGVKVVQGRVTVVDATARRVDSETGRFDYDRLVLAPGVDLRLDGAGATGVESEGTIRGYDQAATARMPHAWKPGIQTIILREQLREMPDGGTVVIAAPPDPSSCPTAPYERASLVAWLLKQDRPRCKVVILDAKDAFMAQAVFQQAWAELFPGMVEWVPANMGGRVVAVDAAAMTLTTEGVPGGAAGRTMKADVASVIPPQRAGNVAQAAGVADRSGWCPVDAVTFESLRVPRVHVIGDAAALEPVRKTAFAAAVQAEACADAVTALLAGLTPPRQKLIDTVYSLVQPAYGLSVTGVYTAVGKQWAPVEGSVGVSATDAPAAVRAKEAAYAQAWFRALTGTIFG